jgi:hypothetical protein
MSCSSKRKYKRLSPSTWAEIEGQWAVGDVTLADLSESYGVSPRTLQARFAKMGISKGSKAKEIAAAVKNKIFQSDLNNSEIVEERAKATRESSFINATIVEELIMGQLRTAQQDPSSAFKAASALKALSLAAAGLERLHNLKWHALGLDRESATQDQICELTIRELSDEEARAMRDGVQGSEDDRM